MTRASSSSTVDARRRAAAAERSFLAGYRSPRARRLRLVYGARTSLVIGIVANAVAVLIGTVLGAAGYAGGWIGTAIMRFTDLMMAFPALLLAIALAAILKPSLWIVAMVIALVNWVQTARVIYTQTRALVELPFIEAARALGAAWPRILWCTCCRICCPTSWYGARSASRSPCCSRRRSRSSASACSRRRRPGAASSSRARAVPDRAVARVLPRRLDPPAGAVVQPRRRRAARRSRPHPAGARVMLRSSPGGCCSRC